MKVALLAAASLALLSTPALADPPGEPSNLPHWAFGSGYGELGLGAVSVLSLGLNLVPPRHSGLGPDAARAFDPGYDTASYVTAFAVPAFAVIVSAGIESSVWSGLGQPETSANRAVLIELESFMLAEGLTGGLKAIVGRCRPRAWDGHACSTSDSDNFAAFPSGHTSGVSAIAGANLGLAIRSHGKLARLRWTTFVLAELTAIATAALRVGAGAHSVTDVLGGFVLGNGTGVGVAYLHAMDPEARTASRSSPLAWLF